ncbi:hypothetical protein AYO47_06455 [Planctomyces sp. SCGC AG-212-M04]|nr:hypothetical protein AYO47_06455 [Planctomyces sp. SCGC AG-212-M04]
MTRAGCAKRVCCRTEGVHIFDSTKARKKRIDLRGPSQAGAMPLCDDRILAIASLAKLTPAERLVLRHIVWLHANRSTARALRSRTLVRHRERILQQLEVKSDIELILRVVVGNPSPEQRLVWPMFDRGVADSQQAVRSRRIEPDGESVSSGDADSGIQTSAELSTG